VGKLTSNIHRFELECNIGMQIDWKQMTDLF